VKANAYLRDVLTIAGPLIDASNATDVRLTDRLTISRRQSYAVMRDWYVYIDAREPHHETIPFTKIADAFAYLLGEPGRSHLDDHQIEWPLIRLPELVSSDLPLFARAPNHIVYPGVYSPKSNPHGALFLTAANGKELGIKPDEFEWVLAPTAVIANAEPAT
jgi:hypothetical protein